jgi:hypothetical protein
MAAAAPSGARVNLFADSHAYAESFAKGQAFDWIKQKLVSLGPKSANPGASR